VVTSQTKSVHHKTCSVENCTKRAITHGWCSKHYTRWRAYGDPEAVPEQGSARQNPAWFMIDLALGASVEDCIIWPFQRDRHGRATAKVAQKQRNVCRELCRLRHGSPAYARYEAAHTCGNGHKGCVNPDHLKWKSTKDNAADRIGHGTINKQHLTEDKVLEIRGLAGTMTGRALAEMYGLSSTSVSSIIRRKTWTHI